MIFLDGDELILLSDVPRLDWMPKRRGKRLSVASVYRWVRRGVRGKKLATVRTPSGMATTETALKEFISELNDQAVAPLQLRTRNEAKHLAQVNTRLDVMLGPRRPEKAITQ